MTTEYRYFVVRMEVDVDEFFVPLDREHDRIERAEDQLRDMVGYSNARKASKNAIVREVFPN